MSEFRPGRPAGRKVGNLLALAVLSYLSGEPMHPYQLSRTLREHGDDRSVKFTHGSLYAVVEQLRKAGFVVPQEVTRAGQRPERTVYAITDAGRRELQEWLGDLIAEPEHEYPHFVTALSFIAALPPDEALEHLRTRVKRIAEERTRIRALIDGTRTQGVHALFLIEEEFRIAMLEAERAFVQSFIKQIIRPRTGWSGLWAQAHARIRSRSKRTKA
jgi:DNA-binding PadR family transcriptional regulator